MNGIPQPMMNMYCQIMAIYGNIVHKCSSYDSQFSWVDDHPQRYGGQLFSQLFTMPTEPHLSKITRFTCHGMSACHDVATKTLSAASGFGGYAMGTILVKRHGKIWENDIKWRKVNSKCKEVSSSTKMCLVGLQNAVRICQDTTVETRWVDASLWLPAVGISNDSAQHDCSIYCELRRSIANMFPCPVMLTLLAPTLVHRHSQNELLQR